MLRSPQGGDTLGSQIHGPVAPPELWAPKFLGPESILRSPQRMMKKRLRGKMMF